MTLPRVVTEVKPEYTAAAMQARIQGTIWMTAVVLANGIRIAYLAFASVFAKGWEAEDDKPGLAPMRS